MEQQYRTVTDASYENAEGTQVKATLNGKTYSGITAKSRFWKDIQNFIDNGGEIAPQPPQPEPTPEELLEQERSGMRSSPAQMRLALHRLGLLTQVQAIADSDPEASIVWEYATTIERTSPLIDALGGPNGFTPEQIDDIFRTAMEISV